MKWIHFYTYKSWGVSTNTVLNNNKLCIFYMHVVAFLLKQPKRQQDIPISICSHLRRHFWLYLSPSSHGHDFAWPRGRAHVMRVGEVKWREARARGRQVPARSKNSLFPVLIRCGTRLVTSLVLFCWRSKLTFSAESRSPSTCFHSCSSSHYFYAHTRITAALF